MTKPKKKKPNIRNLEKVARLQQKNEYYRKVRRIFEVVNATDAYNLLPAEQVEILYDYRYQAVNILVAENDEMPRGKIKWIKRLVSAMLKRYEVKISNEGGTVDLDTFFTAGITIFVYQRSITIDAFRNAEAFKNAMEPYVQYVRNSNEAYDHIQEIIENTALMLSDVTKRMYWATTDYHMGEDDINNRYLMVWQSVASERLRVLINGESRITYRLGLPEYMEGVHWISIEHDDHDLPVEDATKPLNVYIQDHAIRRMSERMDCLSRETIFDELITSVQNFHTLFDDKNSKILVEYYLYGVKTGYLVSSIVGNNLIIQTFLFITNTGTPEGDKLRANTRLKKQDMAFLELDKLSTFITPEIQDNVHIKHLFIEAGCKGLFKLYEILLEKNIAITKHPNTTLIEGYLGLDLTKEYLEEEEEPEEVEEEEGEFEMGTKAQKEERDPWELPPIPDWADEMEWEIEPEPEKEKEITLKELLFEKNEKWYARIFMWILVLITIVPIILIWTMARVVIFVWVKILKRPAPDKKKKLMKK